MGVGQKRTVMAFRLATRLPFEDCRAGDAAGSVGQVGVLARQNRSVVLRRARRGRREAVGAEDDLVERRAIFTHLDADGLRPGGVEVDRRAEAAEIGRASCRERV